MIIIAIIILVVLAFVIYFQSTNIGAGIAIVAFYIFAVLLLVIGVLIAVWS
jgi:hypothetical protein